MLQSAVRFIISIPIHNLKKQFQLSVVNENGTCVTNPTRNTKKPTVVAEDDLLIKADSMNASPI